MGITSSSSSSTESDTRNSQAPPEKQGDPPADWTDQEPIKSLKRQASREISALFPPEQGESSTEAERQKASEERFYKFMRGGSCAEAFTSFQDCVGQLTSTSRSSEDCFELAYKLNNCLYSHHHYYQPYVEVLKSYEGEAFMHLYALAALIRRRRRN